jgi:hypothetical protein
MSLACRKNADCYLWLSRKEWQVKAGFGQCGLLYDIKADAGLYPLGNSVQGVAVGWGIIKKDPLE